MRYPMLALAALLAACATKNDRTADSTAGAVSSDPDVAAQGSGIPSGYTAVTDDSTAKLTSVRYAMTGGNWDVTTGPAHIIYAAKDTARGTYTATATFGQLEAPRHPEAYGIIVGGKDLESPNRTYTYFLVRGNGMFLVKTRQGKDTKDVIAWTANPAVPKADSASCCCWLLIWVLIWSLTFAGAPPCALLTVSSKPWICSGVADSTSKMKVPVGVVTGP